MRRKLENWVRRESWAWTMNEYSNDRSTNVYFLDDNVVNELLLSNHFEVMRNQAEQVRHRSKVRSMPSNGTTDPGLGAATPSLDIHNLTTPAPHSPNTVVYINLSPVESVPRSVRSNMESPTCFLKPQSSQVSSKLLMLPLELRSQILRHILKYDALISVRGHHAKRHSKARERSRKVQLFLQQGINILSTCQQLYSEEIVI